MAVMSHMWRTYTKEIDMTKKEKRPKMTRVGETQAYANRDGLVFESTCVSVKPYFTRTRVISKPFEDD